MKKNGFSLDSFKKNKNETSLNKNKYPYWLDQSNDMVVNFYDKAVSEFGRINEAIESGEELAPLKRQIVKSDITSYFDYDKSNFRKGRPAERVGAFIDELNSSLKEIWGKRNPVKRKNSEKLLRSELEIQNKALKKQVKVVEMAAYRDYFDSWLEEYSKKDTQRMRARIEDLESKIDDLREENITLTSKVKRLRKERLKMIK